MSLCCGLLLLPLFLVILMFAALTSWIEKHATEYARLEPRRIARHIGLGLICFAAVSFFLDVFNGKITWLDKLNFFGFWVTSGGLLLAIIQQYQTLALAKAGRSEYARAASEMAGEHYRYCLGNMLNLIQECQAYIRAYRWDYINFRLQDLCNITAHVSLRPSVSRQWEEVSQRSQEWIREFTKGNTGKKLDYRQEQWLVFCDFVRRTVEGELAPFAFNRENDDATS